MVPISVVLAYNLVGRRINTIALIVILLCLVKIFNYLKEWNRERREVGETLRTPLENMGNIQLKSDSTLILINKLGALVAEKKQSKNKFKEQPEEALSEWKYLKSL